MNFLSTIKDEIFNKNIKDRCCKKAFLAGLIRGSGEIFSNDGVIGFDFSLPDEDYIPIISNYFRILYQFEIREISVSEDKLNKKDKFLLSITGDKAEEILKDICVLVEEDGELTVNFNFFDDSLRKECCLKAFLRGLFLSNGNCTVPSINGSANTRYHLEMVFSHSASASEVSQILSNNGITAKITRRKDKYVLYIKSAEEIKDFLAFIGAPVSVLKLTDMIINGELANVSNRRANCDMGNVNRQINAYEKHLSAINLIENRLGLDYLKKDLLETAKARKEYPDFNLNELADTLGITKSCLNHRLRKIVSIANEL